MKRKESENVRRTIAALALAGLAVGCGGGSNLPPPPDPPTTELVDLGSDAALDGTVTSDGTASADGSFVGPLAGDADSDVMGRVLAAYFSFDLAAIPANADIEWAELSLHQISVLGTPYATHGHLQAQIVDYGSSLEPEDWMPPSFGSVALEPATATIEAKVADVTTFVQEAFAAGRPRFQVRVAFSDVGSDVDEENDAAHFVDAQDAGETGFPPVLSVQYIVP